MRIHNGVRAVGLRSSELGRLTLELADLPMWVEGVKEILSREDVTGRPWHYFADENKVWA